MKVVPETDAAANLILSGLAINPPLPQSMRVPALEPARETFVGRKPWIAPRVGDL
jgi:hypothetical protein